MSLFKKPLPPAEESQETTAEGFGLFINYYALASAMSIAAAVFATPVAYQ